MFSRVHCSVVGNICKHISCRLNAAMGFNHMFVWLCTHSLHGHALHTTRGTQHGESAQTTQTNAYVQDLQATREGINPRWVSIFA